MKQSVCKVHHGNVLGQSAVNRGHFKGIESLLSLKVNDCIDYRFENGQYLLCKVIAKSQQNGNMISVHPVSKSIHETKYHRLVNIEHEYLKLAPPRSVSLCKVASSHPFSNLRTNDYVDINPYCNGHEGWRNGKTIKVDGNSSQIKVLYRNDSDGEYHSFWIPITHNHELATFGAKYQPVENQWYITTHDQFDDDWALLNRLKAFRFEGTDLYIDLRTNASSQSERKDDDMTSIASEDFECILDRMRIVTSSGKLCIHSDLLKVCLVVFIALVLSQIACFELSWTWSMCLIVQKPLEMWSKEDCLRFFEQTLEVSDAAIDKQDIQRILGMMKSVSLSGSKLKNVLKSKTDFRDFVCNQSGNDVMDPFGADKTKKDVVVQELQKLIQLQVMKTHVEDIVPKFEIAKKIQKERIRYHDQGGYDCLNKFTTLYMFKEKEAYYKMVLSRWRFYHYSWKLMVDELRNEYPLLSYYTVHDMRFICDHFNEYKQDRQQSHIQKLTGKFAFIHRDRTNDSTKKTISEWSDLDDKVIEFEFRFFLTDKVRGTQNATPTQQDTRALTVLDLEQLRLHINEYLELQAFAEYVKDLQRHETELSNLANKICAILQIMNPTFSQIQVKTLLTSEKEPVEPFDERLILKRLGQYITDEFSEPVPKTTPFIQTPSVIHRVDTQRFVMQNQEKNRKLLLSGKPHLYFVDEVDLVLEHVINIFSEFDQEPRASQIMFCSIETTLEEMTCFLHRCCFHAEDEVRNLYCLVQPENLQIHITEEILFVLLKKLREKQARLTIICADKTNRWYSDLSIYLSELEPLTDRQRETFHEQYIISLDNAAKSSRSQSSYRAVCVVFLSDTECAGKTYQIKETCDRFKLECVQIPFNSPTVDRDFVVDRLCEGEMQRMLKKQQNKLRKRNIAFHLNISSHAGKDVNKLLFQLLILRHITKSNGESFVVRAHHVFFIELPSYISNMFRKTNIDDVKKHFYFLAGPKSYFHKDIIKMDLQNYYISNENQFVLRYLDALDQTLHGGKPLLQINKNNVDWNYQTHSNVGIDRMIHLVTKFTGKAKEDLNFVFLKSYLDFLYRPFIQLATSDNLIKNALAQDVATGWFHTARYIQYHRVIASSFAKNGSHFACENYEVGNPFLKQQHENWMRQKTQSLRMKQERARDDSQDHYHSDSDDDEIKEQNVTGLEETGGDESFSLAKAFKYADPPIVFLNSLCMEKAYEANIKSDWNFYAKYAENTFTILCQDLDQCQHDDALEWQCLLKKSTNSEFLPKLKEYAEYGWKQRT